MILNTFAPLLASDAAASSPAMKGQKIPDPVSDAAHVSPTSAANMAVSLHNDWAGHSTSAPSPFLYDFKDPGVWQPNDRQAMRMPDVNKHSGILPSKRTSHSCGQCCLTCHVG